MSQVPATRTPFTPRDLLAALHWAFTTQMGHAPLDATLALLCAQVALETSNGGAAVQWNIGNVKRGPGPNWTEFQTVEYLGTPPLRTVCLGQFSAWMSLNDGSLFFVAFLSDHYPEAWTGAINGDASAFCAGLKQRGYFTAPLDAYLTGVQRWETFYASRLSGDHEVTEPEMPISVAGAGVLAIDGLLDGPSNDPT
jgi:hypothetical protein